MSNIQMDLTFRTDVNAPLLTTVLKTLLMQGDDAANVLTVKLYSGAEEVDATGATVSGYLLREDGAKVPLSGSAAGNVVTVNLDKHCYLVAGAFGAYVRLKMGGVTRTILKIAGEIASEGDGPVVDIGEKLVTLEDIIAQMEEMVRVTEAAETATSAANNAAQTANTAAGTAANAASTANGAASTANTAAERANNAAQALEDAPIPTGTVSTYQAGTSPTTPPTGTWQSTIPSVPQGQYLWTRTVQSYTNGEPTTYYSVARQGLDGSGSVVSVDGVLADPDGNVPLGAVRSVNGIIADPDGNVTIEAGGGDVQTVNGVAPDDDGNVQITGENVNVSAADQRTVSQAVGQHDQIVRSMTAAEFEALTTEQKAALYAQGVRVVAVESELDPDSLTDMQRFAAFAHPVGEIVHLTVPTNPATLWGIGTWESYMPGRVLVGAGTADSGTVYVAGETGGEEKHTLTEPELPNVTGTATFHGSGDTGATVLSSVGGHFFAYENATRTQYRSAGENMSGANSFDGIYMSFGSNTPHNIMQPYAAVYRWLRVA